MQLSEPRIRTRTTHGVVITVEDGPIMEAVRGSRGYYRHRIERLSIGYVDGELTEVATDGPVLRVDGQPHASGHSATIDWLDMLPGRGRWSPAGPAGTLREDTPAWVRDAVQAHPWPVSDDDHLAGVLRRLIADESVWTQVAAGGVFVIDGSTAVEEAEERALRAAGADSW